MASEPCDCIPCRIDASRALENGLDLGRPPTLLEVADMLVNQHFNPEYHRHVPENRPPFTTEHHIIYQLIRDLTADEDTCEALLWRHAIQGLRGYYENGPNVRTEKPDRMGVCNNQKKEKREILVDLNREGKAGPCSACEGEDPGLVAGTAQAGGEDEAKVEAGKRASRRFGAWQ